MEYVVIAMMVLAVYHYVLQSAIVPSLRSHLRYEAFALRDELRQLKMQHGKELSDPVFHSLQDSVNFLISDMWRITIFNLIAARRAFDSHPEIKKQVQGKLNSLDSCKIKEVVDLRKRMTRLSIKAAAIDAAGWWIYIVPVIWAVACVSRSKKLLRLVLAAPKGLRDGVILPYDVGSTPATA
ncbi:hypothetical protein LP085_03430 [Achromobacter sp. MY14]|uniref:hypothetical protein n=1 Tax=unclassified Achromobacter TaxID=2626865 RepID=UPI001E43B3E4|nr:hypothetical protein [Achromobacter sp. MY14]MCD0495894.1 hypothetical protein [Achromobacter sp. MY14]